MNSEGAIEEIGLSAELSSQSANAQALSNSLKAVTESSQGMDEAAAALDDAIIHMDTSPEMYTNGKLDPFKQMMYAIGKVLPLTMLFKEEKLLYDTVNFEAVTQLNNELTELMGHYAKAGDYVADPDSNPETGSTMGTTDGVKWGKAAGEAYYEKARELQGMLSTLPDDIKAAFSSALEDIVGTPKDENEAESNKKSLADGIWSGLQAPYRKSNDAVKAHGCSFFPNQKPPNDTIWTGDVRYYDNLPGMSCTKIKLEGGNHYKAGLFGDGYQEIRMYCSMDNGATWHKSYEYRYYCYTNGWGDCCPEPERVIGGSVKQICSGVHESSDNSVGRDTYVKVTPDTPGEMWAAMTAEGMYKDGGSSSYETTEKHQGKVANTTAANVKMQTSLNSYSAKVGAEYTFDMEQYNVYAATYGDVMNEHLAQVGMHSKRLARISHA